MQPLETVSAAPQILILGATGSIGSALALNLLGKNIPVAVLVRDAAKAAAVLGAHPLLTVHTGDVQNADLLTRLCAGKQHIFHGVNYPYHQWFGTMDVATEKVIAAASATGAIIWFPGNVYAFGLPMQPIREGDAPHPISKKGELRQHIEGLLQAAANTGRCQVCVVRMPNFWGPGVTNEGIRPIFDKAAAKQPMPYLGRTDIPQQMVYVPDAAEAIARLMQTPVKGFVEYNYGGTTFAHAADFFAAVADAAHAPNKVQIWPLWQVHVLSLFVPVIRAVKEMLYLYTHSVLVNDAKLRAALPGFAETPLPTAMQTTLRWYATHPKS